MIRQLAILVVVVCAGQQLRGQNPPSQFDRVAALAQSARDQNKLADALNFYRQALAAKPDWKDGWWYTATILFDQERYSESRTALLRFIALAPGAGDGHALLGLCDFQLKRYAEALDSLHKARGFGVESASLASVSLFHYALLLTRFEQYDASGQMLLAFALRGQLPPSIVEATGIAGLRKPLLPSEIPAQDVELVNQAGSAMCAAVAHKNLEARQTFDRMVKNYPDQPEVHYLRGSFLLPSDPAAAFADFENTLRLNPNHVPALVALAMEHLNHADPDKALPLAERAVRADPKSVAGHAAMGKVLTETRAFDRAIEELQTAAKLAPDSPQVRIALASAYAKAGRNEEAAHERAEFLRLRKLTEAPEGK